MTTSTHSHKPWTDKGGHVRGTDQWPFVRGFLLFGLFAFFFELVPYLPASGPTSATALARCLPSLAAAHQQERQRQIRYEGALQALGRNQCPSCERSLTRSEGQLPNFCMHCGLQIQRDCTRCNHHHLSFFPYRSPSPGRHEVEARDMRRRLR
jgi:predicted RNA-binding Zn-ribbon protein involved in translation (DUF1610 family)